MLKGQAKVDYQRDYMRKRRSNEPSVRPMLDPVRPVETSDPVRPSVRPLPLLDPPVRPTLADLIALGNANKLTEVPASVAPLAPVYNPAIHRPGDTVRMRDAQGRMRVVVVPDMDGDGQPIPV